MPDAVMVTSSFLPGRGGIESFLAELLALVEPRIAVLAPAERDNKALPDDLGYPTRGYAGTLLVPNRRIVTAVEEAARAYGTDKVVFGTPWPLIFLGPQLRARGLRYASLVYGAETLVPSVIPGLRRRLARALSGADLLLPISHFTSGVVKSLLDKTNRAVPPMELVKAQIDIDRFRPGIDTGRVRERLQIGPDEKVILCFGRLVKRKGVDRMIRAMPEIARRIPNVVLVVAGAGPEEPTLRRLAQRYGRVAFAGRVPDDEAAAVYCSADVFALPVVDRWFGLEAEGLGVVLLEAQACEVPCVTGRSGGSPEAIEDGRSGLVVDAHDRDQLVNGVTRLLADPEEAGRMGRAGRAFVEREYSARRPPAGLLDWLDGRETR